MKLKTVNCEIGLSFAGAPAVLRIRVFVKSGKVVGLRRLSLRQPDGSSIRTYNVGVIDAKTLDPVEP